MATITEACIVNTKFLDLVDDSASILKALLEKDFVEVVKELIMDEAAKNS